MQGLIVGIILAAAIVILWRHGAPVSLRAWLNRAFRQTAIRSGCVRIADRLAKQEARLTGGSACGSCCGCSAPRQINGCEVRIRPEDIPGKR
ncbi:MAG: hypothetical protein LBM56_02020 [Burkholderiaceae bacterium]|jgi:hypothetical protein|nr:hypothetical protein [Burkholderiaceae bacterium]